MIVSLGTYDLEMAKESFKKSGISEVGHQAKEAFKQAQCPSYLVAPFINALHLVDGVRRLLLPNNKKDIEILTNRINELANSVDNSTTVRKRDIQELEVLLNKLVWVTKKTGDKNAIEQAKKYRSDFKIMFKKFL